MSGHLGGKCGKQTRIESYEPHLREVWMQDVPVQCVHAICTGNHLLVLHIEEGQALPEACAEDHDVGPYHLPVGQHHIAAFKTGHFGANSLNLSGGYFLVKVDGLYTQAAADRSEEHTSELQSLMRISYAVFCF